MLIRKTFFFTLRIFLFVFFQKTFIIHASYAVRNIDGETFVYETGRSYDHFVANNYKAIHKCYADKLGVINYEKFKVRVANNFFPKESTNAEAILRREKHLDIIRSHHTVLTIYPTFLSLKFSGNVTCLSQRSQLKQKDLQICYRESTKDGLLSYAGKDFVVNSYQLSLDLATEPVFFLESWQKIIQEIYGENEICYFYYQN